MIIIIYRRNFFVQMQNEKVHMCIVSIGRAEELSKKQSDRRKQDIG